MGKWCILCYHTMDGVNVPSFRRHVQYLRSRGYHFCSFEEAWRARILGQTGWRATVTFDDGDWSVCDGALSVLSEEGIAPMLYVTTDYIVQGRRYRDPMPRRCASWRQLQDWLAAGREIGYHTHTHADLTGCSVAQWDDELGIGSSLIERELGFRPRHFAYPYGRSNQAFRRWIAGRGEWLSAVGVQGRINRDRANPFNLGRFVLDGNVSIDDLYLKLQPMGVRYVQRRIRRLLRGLKRALERAQE